MSLTGTRRPPGQVYSPTRGRRTWVSRPRLLRLLGSDREETTAPIVVISGPAGAGKSVLTRQWLESDRRMHLEVPIRAALDEPSVLTHTLVDALEQIGPSARNLRAGITSTEPQLSTIVLPALARLAGSRTGKYVLVLDDIHLLRDPDCQSVIRAVCDGIPEGCRAILLTREETPAWLARARAEDRLTEISGEDLRFDAEEAAEMFQGLGLVGQDVDEVLAHTEGWAVGLYLTALAMRRAPVKSSFDASAPNRDADRFVGGYIGAEVLSPLDPELASFVLRTSVLDELEPGLCDVVLDRTDSRAILARLQEQLQLVIPLDPSGDRVRYHHLLTDAARRELSHRSPAEVPVLHLRASRWYAQKGLMDEAIRHAKAADDLAEVGRLVWSSSGHCIGSGDKDRLAFWLADLTEPRIAEDRWLSLTAAWVALQSGNTDMADRWILRAEGHAGEGWPDRACADEYAAELAVIVAVVGYGGLVSSEALCSAALRGLPAESPYRTAALFIRGVALSLGREIEQGLESLVEAERLARVLQVPLVLADALSWQGVLALAAGDLPRARRIIDRATDVVFENQLERCATAAHCITAQALLLSLTNDPEAPATLGAARLLTSRLGDAVPWFAVCGRLIQARAAVALGEGALARQLLIEAKTKMSQELNDSLARDLYDDVERTLTMMKVDGVAVPVLTAAELRVLQFLPSHLQVAQIAQHLFVSANTVKTHVMSIHRKLNVNSRAEAVARARDLGLLEAPVQD